MWRRRAPKQPRKAPLDASTYRKVVVVMVRHDNEAGRAFLNNFFYKCPTLGMPFSWQWLLIPKQPSSTEYVTLFFSGKDFLGLFSPEKGRDSACRIAPTPFSQNAATSAQNGAKEQGRHHSRARLQLGREGLKSANAEVSQPSAFGICLQR